MSVYLLQYMDIKFKRKNKKWKKMMTSHSEDGESYIVVIFLENLYGGMVPFSWFELRSLKFI